MNRKGYQANFLCAEATKTDSPHGSGEASHVLYDDDPLVDFMLNNFRTIVDVEIRSILLVGYIISHFVVVR